jgi:hypothetical protein
MAEAPGVAISDAEWEWRRSNPIGTAIPTPRRRPPTPNAGSIHGGAPPEPALDGLRRLSGIIFGNTSRTALAAGAKLCRIFGTASRSACAVGLRLSPALWAASRSTPAATPPHARGNRNADSRSRGREGSVGASRGTFVWTSEAPVIECRRGTGGGGKLGTGSGGLLAALAAIWLGASTPELAFVIGAGRNVPPAVIRDSGGGGGFDACRGGGIGAGGAPASVHESSMSKAPLTSSISGATGSCGGAFPSGARPFGTGLGRPGSPEPAESGTSRLECVADFGSLSSFTDGPMTRIPPRAQIPCEKSAP